MKNAKLTRHALILMKPVKGQRGELLARLNVLGETEQAAISALRAETEAGSDLVIMGEASYHAAVAQAEQQARLEQATAE